MRSRPAPQHPFRFLELSAELRNQIYEFLLVDHKPFWPTLQTIYRCESSINAAILRVCRQTHEEATAMLYASNTFQGYREHIFATWLPSIGRNIKHIRSLEVDHVQTAAFFYEMLPPLKKAISLQRLDLSYIEPNWKAEELAKMVAPFMRAIHRARKRKDGDRVEGVLDMLVLPRYYDCKEEEQVKALIAFALDFPAERWKDASRQERLVIGREISK
ncbi:hypothetical protein CLAFUW4_13413 [Fulvia fulva]|uniref:Uncharacterized protein n=1 Tax=Passalora fulva TaxID=5499 RepID=A0A9Q8PIS3_PASFU|nr:uncharacterized protein CLAFUR5_13266 [Fulvia fulva]KAK4612200.1 hypothetical protein CLAFUR4_13416 [Fulvia fulva]KAK4612546.1 hypothetical protein CLAFUR0_13423 [Fulvia fulva]UJO23331.1 hypothetical protein CLAFUR5_13266 [Fulvia fulva]WPV21219.1 hypothetical protein CLAFUW4_13413 [Fulvia fulva]WPV35799.1 hypothetical protein CLAFUW7_13420 [Fulvia fulva]